MISTLIEQALHEAQELAKPMLHTGKVASYIPELAKTPSSHLGACVMTMQGEYICVGDWQHRFTLQSVSKTITLILALQLVGVDELFSKIGVEPTGDAFNSLVRLETKSYYPYNPMINAGAIVASSYCVAYDNNAYDKFLKLARKLCNNEKIGIDNNVYKSEDITGHRNRSIAYLLQAEGVLRCDTDKALDFYFKMCSTLVNCKDLAHFSCVLAGNGKNPQTGEVLLESWIARIVKTLMLTCGMYEASGRFAMKAGIPAKSGVGGGIMACVENKIGIATYGPALNSEFSSVGGVIIIEYLSKKLGLHLLGGNVSYSS